MTLASLQERRDREQALSMQRESAWVGMNLDMDSKNAANNIGTDIAAAWPQALEHLLPAAKQFKANQDARALYIQRISDLQAKPKYSRLTLQKLEETYGEDKVKYKHYSDSYKDQVAAREAGFRYSLSKALNTNKNNLLNRNDLEKYTKQKLSALAPYIEGIFASGIPLIDKDTGKIIELSNSNLTEQELSSVIQTLSHEYFYDARFFDENGKGGPTDNFLHELKFGEKLNDAQSKILEDRVRIADQADQAETKLAVGDLIWSGFDDRDELDVDLLLNMELSLDENQEKGKPSYTKAWDALFKRVEDIQVYSPMAAEYLLDQLELHPRAGKSRIESARAKLHQSTGTAIDDAKAAEAFQLNAIKVEFLAGRISVEDLIAGSGDKTKKFEWNQNGLVYNWKGMIGEKQVAGLGDAESNNEALWAAFNYDGTVPDPTEKYKHPVGSHETIDAINLAGNTYASRKNDENKEAWQNDRSQIEGAIGGVLPNWEGQVGMLDTKFQKMAEAAVNDYEHRVKQLVGEGLPIAKAMSQAQALVLDELKNVTDSKSAKQNIYYLAGNRGYDQTLVGNIQTVDDFILNNVENLDDLTELTKSEEYSDFITAFGRLDKKELQSLKYVATGKWWKQGKLPPTFELLYTNLRHKYPKADYLTNFPPNQKVFARALLTASGTKFKTDESDGRDKAVKQIQESGDPRSDPYLQCLAKVEANPSIANKLAVLEMAAKCGVNLN